MGAWRAPFWSVTGGRAGAQPLKRTSSGMVAVDLVKRPLSAHLATPSSLDGIGLQLPQRPDPGQQGHEHRRGGWAQLEEGRGEGYLFIVISRRVMTSGLDDHPGLRQSDTQAISSAVAARESVVRVRRVSVSSSKQFRAPGWCASSRPLGPWSGAVLSFFGRSARQRPACSPRRRLLPAPLLRPGNHP